MSVDFLLLFHLPLLSGFLSKDFLTVSKIMGVILSPDITSVPPQEAGLAFLNSA